MGTHGSGGLRAVSRMLGFIYIRLFRYSHYCFTDHLVSQEGSVGEISWCLDNEDCNWASLPCTVPGEGECMGDWDTPLGVLLAHPIDCAVYFRDFAAACSAPSDVTPCGAYWNLLQAQIMPPTLSR